jgi:hypothetical protein
VCAAFGIVACIAAVPLFGDSIWRAIAPAQAQVPASLEFRAALEPYGRWVNHQRWGEVWVPADVDREWRPYQLGHWVYTDEWGWFWNSDEDFGWIVYHYGRWAFDRELRWVWIPGDEWGPAWVQWRRGADVVAWAPLPPEEVIDEYEEEPEVWVAVPVRQMTAPRLVEVVVPRQRVTVIFRDTVIVNRTVYYRDRRRPAVNPGVPPMFIAAAIGRPIRAVEVRPPVLRGTIGVRFSVEIGADRFRGDRQRRERVRVDVRETRTEIAPAATVPPPQRLERGQPGRLGDRPPAASREAGPPAMPGAPKAKDKGAPLLTKDKDKGAPTPLTKNKDKGAPKADKGPPPAPKAAPKADKGPPPAPKSEKGPAAPKAAPKADKGPPPAPKADKGPSAPKADKGPPPAKKKGPEDAKAKKKGPDDAKAK